MSGTKTGTSTDSDGYFRLPVKVDSLVITAVGYRAVRVRARTGQVIVLPEDEEVPKGWDGKCY